MPDISLQSGRRNMKSAANGFLIFFKLERPYPLPVDTYLKKSHLLTVFTTSSLSASPALVIIVGEVLPSGVRGGDTGVLGEGGVSLFVVSPLTRLGVLEYFLLVRLRSTKLSRII